MNFLNFHCRYPSVLSRFCFRKVGVSCQRGYLILLDTWFCPFCGICICCLLRPFPLAIYLPNFYFEYFSSLCYVRETLLNFRVRHANRELFSFSTSGSSPFSKLHILLVLRPFYLACNEFPDFSLCLSVGTLSSPFVCQLHSRSKQSER